MTPEEFEQLKRIMLSLVPRNGNSIGNAKLMNKFFKRSESIVPNLEEDDYWEIRNELVSAGTLTKGKGRGGSVILTEQANRREAEYEIGENSQLRDYFYKMLSEYWVKEQGIREFVLEKSSPQEGRRVIGTGTAPHLTLISIGKYTFIPGKVLEVMSFDVRQRDTFHVTDVFRAAAHHAFAHKSCLAIHISRKGLASPDLERIKSECRKLLVGLIVFTDPNDYKTTDLLVEPIRIEPDPRDINDFITKQISSENQAKLLQMIK